MKRGLFIVALIIFSGCSITETAINNSQELFVATEWETIGKGLLHGAGQEGIEESNVCIRDLETWTSLKHQMDSTNSVSPNFVIKEIDFDTQMVIACFDKVRPNGGYTMKIKEVQESAKSIKILIERETPQGMSTSLMVQPFHIIMLPKSSKELIFE